MRQDMKRKANKTDSGRDYNASPCQLLYASSLTCSAKHATRIKDGSRCIRIKRRFLMISNSDRDEDRYKLTSSLAAAIQPVSGSEFECFVR